MVGIVGSHLTPRLLRPPVALIVSLPARLVDWHMSSLLRPVLQQELGSYHAKGFSREDPNNTTYVPDSAPPPTRSRSTRSSL